MKGNTIDLSTETVQWMKERFSSLHYYRVPIEKTYARILIGPTLNVMLENASQKSPFHKDQEVFRNTIRSVIGSGTPVLAYPLECLLLIAYFEIPTDMNQNQFFKLDGNHPIKGFSSLQHYRPVAHVQDEIYTYTLADKISPNDGCFITEDANLLLDGMMETGSFSSVQKYLHEAAKQKILFSIQCSSPDSLYYIVCNPAERDLFLQGAMELKWIAAKMQQTDKRRPNVFLPAISTAYGFDLLNSLSMETPSGLTGEF
ncbi:MAG: hypothetical protein ABIJ34_04970 [archaeon]